MEKAFLRKKKAELNNVLSDVDNIGSNLSSATYLTHVIFCVSFV